MRPKDERPHLSFMYAGNLRLQAARLCSKVERDAKTMQEALRILKTAQEFEKMVTQRVKTGPRIEYSDWWTATRSLNKYAFRLLICHLIADVCAWLAGPGIHDGEFEDTGMEAAATARADIESIVSAIPYLCEWTEGKERGASSPCGQNDAQSTRGVTHLLVIWPLYLAGDSRFSTVAQKDYIQLKLELMAENLGVRHASAVSKVSKHPILVVLKLRHRVVEAVSVTDRFPCSTCISKLKRVEALVACHRGHGM